MSDPQGGVVGALAGTRPWVRLASIVGFVGAGLMLVTGLLVAGASLIAPGQLGAGAGAGFVALGLLYACMALLYLVPSRHLWRYGAHIGAYVRDQQPAQLEQALEAQRAFWKFVGVLTVLSLLLVVVGFLLALAVPALMLGGALAS
jgi:hypothetical protein